MEEESDNGLFMQFRVKEDMRLAPIKRSHLSEDQQMELDSVISSEPSSIRETYLNILKTGSYVMQRCEQTWPPEDKKDEVDDDIEVIEYDDDEGLDNMDGMIEDVVAGKTEGKHVKAKLLSFCENRRPAYWGTWSKKSSTVSARRPLAKDQIFDYEYDSDDDWEEEEAGESLSDSEGEEKEGEEKEEEGDGDQYEVDNDFFVPHGYLSDDEGRSDEEGAQEESVVEDDGTKNKEKLKQKQAEFEEEMKKKTRHLKPRVLGCLWMADKNNNRAYDQLMKLLSPHKVVNLCSRLPIDIRRRGSLPAVVKDQNPEDEPFQDDKTGGKPKYFKTFPEEAIPHLIRLLHGNRNGKIFLSREFSDYWRKKDLEDDNDETTTTMMPSGGYFIAKKKVESKIKELGRWRKCIDEGPLHKVMMWYVPKVVREQYGLGDLSLPNTWNYINKPKERREVNHEDLESVEEGTKTGKLTPITAFAKKLPQTPVSTLNSPAAASTSATPQTSKADKGSPNSGLAVASSPVTTVNSPSCTSPSALIKNPTGKPTPTIKKRGYIFSSPRGQEVTAQQASFASFFKKPEEKFSTEPSADSKKEERSKDGQENEFVCITLE
ncbi:chromatin assembly factor 1 subunit A-B-like [Homarus americanus]|uniref:chromatin assembly factor 1 subunit A-B-like n=1 Tax=Homarus americanus TaxID=6706 RepID=UPI001C48C476|nr:chromatin assembly factor 1 subunit A-B-like [Homarus americanus]